MQNAAIEIHNHQTLRYRTQAQRILSRNTVLVEAVITTLIPAADHDLDVIEKRVLLALANFISTEWTLQAPSRLAETAGFERVTRRAYTRAPLAEDFNLPERARRASSDGLAITDINVSYAVPGHIIDAAVQELRLTVLKDVASHVQQFGVATGQHWRIADVEFGVDSAEPQYRSPKGAFRTEISDSFEVGGSHSNAERVRILADVVLTAAT